MDKIIHLGFWGLIGLEYPLEFDKTRESPLFFNTRPDSQVICNHSSAGEIGKAGCRLLSDLTCRRSNPTIYHYEFRANLLLTL